MEAHDNLLKLIQCSLWALPAEGLTVDGDIFEEMQRQTLTALPAKILPELTMSDELRQTWQTGIRQNIAAYCQSRFIQASLPIKVPYAVLKGTEAAKYYPSPQLRSMGDIDIMPPRQHFSEACDSLLSNGFQEIPDTDPTDTGRHRQFIKNGIIIEVHAYYAHENDPALSRLIDDLILENIQPDHTLPDPVNGLTLLEHINHHLESGVGLRQIIDWMMFADRCLSDEQWPEFKALIERTGHERLAVYVTKMCVQYLGLPARAWCADADERVCDRLMDYILASGNFGRKISEEKWTVSRFLSSHSAADAFRFLQKRGLINWKAAQKHPVLRPFAWLYQLWRYLSKAVSRPHAASRFAEEYQAGRRKDELLNALGASRESQGLVRFKNGAYTKEKRS